MPKFENYTALESLQNKYSYIDYFDIEKIDRFLVLTTIACKFCGAQEGLYYLDRSNPATIGCTLCRKTFLPDWKGLTAECLRNLDEDFHSRYNRRIKDVPKYISFLKFFRLPNPEYAQLVDYRVQRAKDFETVHYSVHLAIARMYKKRLLGEPPEVAKQGFYETSTDWWKCEIAKTKIIHYVSRGPGRTSGGLSINPTTTSSIPSSWSWL